MADAETVVSWSEVDCFRQCPFKHERAYKERWTRPQTPESALTKGTLWHHVLEAHYRAIQRKESPTEVGRAVGDVLAEAAEDPAMEETVDLIRWMYEGYLDKYLFDEDWEIVAVEYANEFRLPMPDGSASPYMIKMKLDLVVRLKWNGFLFIVDHKSGKNLPTDRMLELDDQFGLYTWGLRLLGKKIQGALYNAARTYRYTDPTKDQPLNERFKRVLMYRTDEELNNIAIEAYRTAHRAYTTPLGEAERAPDTDRCRWRCDFTEPCLNSRKGSDVRQQMLDHGFFQERERH